MEEFWRLDAVWSIMRYKNKFVFIMYIFFTLYIHSFDWSPIFCVDIYNIRAEINSKCKERVCWCYINLAFPSSLFFLVQDGHHKKLNNVGAQRSTSAKCSVICTIFKVVEPPPANGLQAGRPIGLEVSYHLLHGPLIFNCECASLNWIELCLRLRQAAVLK